MFSTYNLLDFFFSKFETLFMFCFLLFRYKIYAEGATWSVSEKYIIACDSMTMFIEPKYYDFFTRNMLPLQHYWPISIRNMCEEIKYAVDWGNSHIHIVITLFLNFFLTNFYALKKLLSILFFLYIA